MWDIGPNPSKDINQALDELAEAHRILAVHGHSSSTLGHMSLRDPSGRGFWLKRIGIGLDEVQSATDFILLDLDGRQLSGAGGRHSEWPIHSEIYATREDVHVICHTHPFYSSLFSATDQELAPLTHEGNYLYKRIAYYRHMHGLITTKALGGELAGCLGKMGVVFMKNHGITVAGPSLAVVGLAAIAAETAARAQIVLASTGYAHSGPDESALESGESLIKLPATRVAEMWDYYRRTTSKSLGKV